ncbi:hypothetical protein AVEN_174177-1 [Araneus ventricosus]|uniref:Cc8L18.2-like protein n=1 Tax=Araneus ventricosus TaxID=182803 RepID=A0A4Y2T9Z7_ARAVE|nr:hypothetical protein AVEN_174177-1 [Araneus ventricosus]
MFNCGSEKETSPAICDVGKNLLESCHKTYYVKAVGLKELGEFTVEDRELLHLRLGNKFEKICFHHEQVYLQKYTHLFGQTCCDPFKRHKKIVKKSLRIITLDTAKKSLGLLLPGKKICPTCETLVKNSHQNQNDTDSDYEIGTPEEYLEKLNNSLQEMGNSPIKKVSKLSNVQRKQYGKRKCEKIVSATKENLATALQVKPIEIENNHQSVDLQNEDLYSLVEELKIKFAETTSHADKVQILTLVPKSWSLEKTKREFSTTMYLVRKARNIKKSFGVLGKPAARQGTKISQEDISVIQTFYESDDISRLCPGKKDFVNVRTDDGKVQKQKRLILCNLKEAYHQFKEQHTNIKIGFSKFAELRPKHCVLAGSNGTHSVCVCTIHQNMKLMLHSIKPHHSLLKIMELYVCSIENQKCMFGECSQCPKENFRNEIEKFEAFQNADEIIYKRWISTDRSTLITQVESTEEFLDSFVGCMPNLTKHHFIAKSQSKYLKDMKLNIPQEECIVLLDFSENYSFIVQDAIQGFHWENSQATIHPLVVYGKNSENQLLTVSMCIISDHTIHDTATVFSFQTAVIPSIKEKFPLVKKLIYFSDGSSAQYKNRKNFVNICHHESDFELKSEWHFFATSHGKSSCDGIGGTVKRLAARTSLHRPYNNQILTAKDLFSFCTATITNIKFFFVPSVNVIEVENKLQQRFNEVPTAILGTRNYHCYIPISNCTSKILVSYLSQSSVKETKV